MIQRRGLAGVVGSSRRNAGRKGIGKACVEALEGRMLLAVTAGEYDAIRSTYPGFNLPASMASVNIIEVTASQLSVANLKSAITTAEGTTLPDLVVLRTTDTQNTITYASSADAISIDIPSTKGAISIVGFGTKPLTIDAASQCRVISVGSTNSTTTVNLGGLTLTRGDSSGSGGGLYKIYGTLNLTNVTISGNTGGYGGGVYLYAGTSTLTNVTISGNTASATYGSGGGVCQSSGTLTLMNVTISGNTVLSSSIGGGGGACLSGISTLTNVTISGNTASNYGGGVFQSSGTSTLTNVTINENTASRGGGGVYQDYGTLNVTNVTISGNAASYGGGVHQYGGTLNLTNVTISGNAASSSGGGGIYQSDGTLNLTNVTISGNTASRSGGGVYQEYTGTATVRNTIVAHNAALSYPDVYVNGGHLGGANNLIGDGTGQTSLVNGSNGNLVGSSASPIDPLLAEGTASGTGLSPFPGSPAIDAGDNSLIPTGISTDIYGAPRIQGARVNIGAVETVLDVIPGVTYVVTSLGDSIAADGMITLREALAAANANQAVGDAPAGSYSAADVITFAPGLSGSIYTNGQAYQITSSVSIVGPGAGQLTLDGGGASGVLDIHGLNDTSITGVTITGGDAENGGGVCVANSRVTLSQMAISGNTASSEGGGVYVQYGTLTLTDVTISGNTGGYGGGLYQYYGTSTLTSTTISSNATKAYGYGGGMGLGHGTATLMGVTISGNTAFANGGGVDQYDGALSLIDVTISGNTASDDGGGVYKHYGTLTLTNVALSGNSASAFGGGVFQSYGPLALTNVTMSGNTAYSGGGLYLDYDTTTLQNTIIARNIARSADAYAGPDIRSSGGSLVGSNNSNNLIGNGSGQISLVNGSNGNVVGTNANPVDPQFLNMAGTDWRNWDLRLQAASPAVNGGNDAWVPAGVTSDIMGGARIVDGTVDMGAYERQPTDIVLSAYAVTEHLPSGTVVGTLSTVDSRPGDVFTYSLVTGAGSTDNASFTISGDQLLAAASFNWGVKGSYSIRVRSTSQGGSWRERIFTIYVTNINEAPTDIAWLGSIAEHQPIGTVVGGFSTIDPDCGDTFTYTLVSGTGSTDNGSFTVNGSSLLAAAVFDYQTKSSYSVRIRSTDQGGLWFEKAFTISVRDVNETPTDILLNNTSVAENQAVGTVVGTLSTADPDAGNTFAYTLVSGTGSTDNVSFTISGNQLLTAASFNFEFKSSYSIRVRTTDQGGLYTEKAFTITVTNVNEAPTGVALSSSSIAENQPTGTTVGTLSTTDPDAGNTFTYSLVSGTGSTNNGSFTISGSTLMTAASFNYESKSSYSIRVRTTDQGGLWYEKAFTITVTNVNETPTNIVLSNASVVENQSVGTVVGMLSAADPDAGGAFAYTLESGTGSTDNGSFTISGNQLLTAASFDFEAKSSYSIRVRTTDQGGLYTEKSFTITVTDVDEIAPTVTAVYVRGSAWNSNYLSFLATNTPGSSATYGYAIPVGSGAAQLQTLPWRNLNQISLRFSEDVSIAQAQVAIVGSVGSYSVSGFSYSSIDHVATWSLSAVIGPDKLYVALLGSGSTPVKDAAGNVLDGEWSNPSGYSDAGPTSVFPSGNGTAGGDFAFRLDVLPGDSTGGSLGKVNVADIAQTKSRSGLPVSLSSYRSDFDGNNLVNVADIAYVKSRSGTNSLPVNPPVLPVFGLAFSQVSLLKSRSLALW